MKLAVFLFFIRNLQKKKSPIAGLLSIATRPVGSPQEPSGTKVTARIPAQDAFCSISSRKPNEIKRHIVLLRRLGTAGVYPFQSSAMTFILFHFRHIFYHTFPEGAMFFRLLLKNMSGSSYELPDVTFSHSYRTGRICPSVTVHKPPTHNIPVLWQHHLPWEHPGYDRIRPLQQQSCKAYPQPFSHF